MRSRELCFLVCDSNFHIRAYKKAFIMKIIYKQMILRAPIGGLAIQSFINLWIATRGLFSLVRDDASSMGLGKLLHSLRREKSFYR